MILTGRIVVSAAILPVHLKDVRKLPHKLSYAASVRIGNFNHFCIAVVNLEQQASGAATTQKTGVTEKPEE